MLGLFRKNIKFGLDLGQDSLKYAIVEKDTVSSLWTGEILPERNSKDDILKDEALIKKLTFLLNDCKKDCPGYRNHIKTTLQGEGVISRYIELPKMDKKEVRLAVTSQAIKYIPFPMDTVNLSYINVPAISSESNKMGIFFVAAQKKSVEEIKKILEGAGLELEAVETPVLAMVRAFSKNHKVPDDHFFALIHTGFRLTHIIILRGQHPYYSREISLAGRDFTYAFQMGHQSSWEEAEKHKLSYDLEEKEVSIEPFVLRWEKEIKKTLGYFTRQLPGKCKVEEVFLSGGSAYWKSLDKRLSEYLDMPVRVDFWDNLKKNHKISDKENIGFYQIAIGLALGDG